MKIAVLGGGISGLAASHYLSHNHHATLFRGPMRGGWVNTYRSRLTNTILELGPRSLRHAGTGQNTLELLGLAEKVRVVPKTSDAAKNRFIYHGSKLNCLSPSISAMMFSEASVLEGLLWSLIKEPFRPIGPDDERRLGPNISNRIVSAVVHGIYAGDVANLSIKSTFKSLWQMEKEFGSIAKGMFLYKPPKYRSTDVEAQKFIDKVSEGSVYSFDGGLQTLTDRLEETIVDKVGIVEQSCIGLKVSDNHVDVTLQDQTTQRYDHVVCGLSAMDLAPLLDPGMRELKETLEQIKGVDVAVVNLVYEKAKMPVQGFGFLVPKTEKDFPILGVVFDSCAFPQDEYTVLTVMMGGHRFAELFGDVDTVSHVKLLADAVAAVDKSLGSRIAHLGISGSLLVDSHVSIQKQCIPQYTVGHEARLERLDRLVGKRMSLIGSSYRGVSVNDCIWNAKIAALALK